MDNDGNRLIEAYLQSRPDAVREIDRWIGPVVHHRAWRLGNPEDLQQEVRLRLIRVLQNDGFRGKSSLKTFVQSIAQHVCIDEVRRRRVADRILPMLEPGEFSDDGPDVELERRETVSLCQAVLERLPDRCRELLGLIFIDDLPQDEIAGRLGVAIGTIKSRLSRCRDHAVGIRRELLTEPSSAKTVTSQIRGTEK